MDFFTNKLKSRKTLISILIILFVLILATVGYLFYYQQQTKKTATVPTKKTLTNLEMSEQTYNWLNDRRNDEGFYPYSCDCNTTRCTSCTNKATSWREGPFYVWGRYKYYKKTNNSDDLTKINQEMAALTNKTLQFVDWDCRILLDLWNDSSLDNKTKQNITNLCTNNGRDSIDFNFIFNFIDVTADSKKMNSIVNVDDIQADISKIISNQPIKIDSKFYDFQLLKSNFYKNAFFTSENIAKKTILSQQNQTEDEKVDFPKIDNIKAAFKYALYGYSSFGSSVSVYENAVLGIASLDMYHYFGDQKYLDLANYLYSQNKTKKIIANYSNLAYQTFFLSELGKVTNQNYSTEINNNLKTLTDNFFDSNFNAFKIDGRLSIKENWFIVGLLTL